MIKTLTTIAVAAILTATSVSAFGDVTRTNVPLTDGSSAYGFSFVQTGGEVTYVTNDSIVGSRTELVSDNTIVVSASDFDIYEPTEVEAWVQENFNDDVNTYAAVLSDTCGLSNVQKDPDAVGACRLDDGVSGTAVGGDGQEATRW